MAWKLLYIDDIKITQLFHLKVDEILEQNLILPSETVCCQVLKRLHSLQQKHQPIIPRHMHFLRLTALREHSLPDGLIAVLRDPCQYFPGSKVSD